MGCNGGWIQNAFAYLENTGIVEDSCFPYGAGTGNAPQCAAACKDSTQAFKKYKCKKGSTVVATTPEQIQSALVAGGPMETRFDVYADFMSYKGGIYKHTTGDRRGGHAIKLVGYGVEGADKYWILANSWGPAWGENGYFRMAYGECGIDTTVLGCEPEVSYSFLE